jgi:hypothetical protein
MTHVTWRRFFDANEPAHALVDERDGALIGLGHYIFHRFHRATTAIAPICYLNDLFTDASARGGGSARR